MRRRPPLLLFILPLLLLFLIALAVECPGRKVPDAEKTMGTAAPSPGFRRTPDRPPAPARPAARAAIIIDDLGYNLETIERLWAVGRPLTLSVLPHAPLTAETVRLAEAAGFEIMLHLPLEPSAAETGIGEAEGMIREGMAPGEIRASVEASLSRVPGARGVNNHAGSRATEVAAVMRPVLEVLKARGLYFIDSRTTTSTVAFREAVRMGIPAAARRVFLDADPEESAIRARLQELFRAARKHGRAVGICHPRRETLEALARHIGLADEMGVTLVFASAVVE